MDRTSAVGEEPDEPRVEADAVGGSEPDVLIDETEAGGSNRVGLSESGKHRDVDKFLLKGDEQRHTSHHYAPNSVQQGTDIRHHV